MVAEIVGWEQQDTMTNSSDAPPRVTIGLPVYNGANYLREAIESLLSQSFDDFELIISDNASTDDTQAICEHYAASDARVRYERCSTNLGASRNYNRLVAMARGEFFKWAAHDDNCHPEFIAECISALDREPNAVLCFPSVHLIDDTGAIVSKYPFGLNVSHTTAHERLVAYLTQNFIRKKRMCNPIFGVIRLSALQKTRLIQNFIGSDRSLLAHLALLGKFIQLPDFLFERRVHFGISTMAERSFSGRKAWFDSSVNRQSKTRSRFNNHLALRLTHIRDFFRAISELVDDKSERRKCRVALAKLLLTDLKWVYRDIKYSLGFHHTSEQIMAKLKKTRKA